MIYSFKTTSLLFDRVKKTIQKKGLEPRRAPVFQKKLEAIKKVAELENSVK